MTSLNMNDSVAPIVVVGFNRPNSLSRLLGSLAKANYPNKSIPLIISVDRGTNNQDVLEVANDFYWENGEKTVNYQSENLGLRKHILQCGDLSLTYGSIIVLEDDLYVSPNFYFYTLEALRFSEDKDYIGGISLYNHQTNVHTSETFLPIDDGYDNWYFQFASSWGQAWTKNQWEKFKNWYAKHEVLPQIEGIPKNVSSWSDKSWLKFFIVYLIEFNTYFLYPKISLTTNFSDTGTHVGVNTSGYQVPLLISKKEKYFFARIEESKGVYNAFYENVTLARYLDIPENDLSVDLYGYLGESTKRYWLTSTMENYKIIKSFQRSLRPIDLNVIYELEGDELFLYDTSSIANNNNKENRYNKIMYSIRHLLYNDLLYLFKIETRAKVKRVLKKVKGKF